MQGQQLTFFTQQDRTVGEQPLTQWLLEQIHALDLKGATLTGALQGLGHDGRTHALTWFDSADQPLQLRVVASAEACQRLLETIRAHQVEVFYVLSNVEYGYTSMR